MAIAANQSIKLNVHAPKKDAVVATGTPTVAADEVGIFIGTAVPINNPQQIVGDLRKVYRAAQTELKQGQALVRMPLGGGDPSITAGGSPGTTDVCLYIGANIGGKQQSHYLDRTFKRLLERWLELGKGPNDAGVSSANIWQPLPGIISVDGIWSEGMGFEITLTLTDPQGQDEVDVIAWTADRDYETADVIQAVIDAIDDLVHWTALASPRGLTAGPSSADYTGVIEIQVM